MNHAPNYNIVKGKTIVSCSCGKNLGKYMTQERAAQAWVEHVQKARA